MNIQKKIPLLYFHSSQKKRIGRRRSHYLKGWGYKVLGHGIFILYILYKIYIMNAKLILTTFFSMKFTFSLDYNFALIFANALTHWCECWLSFRSTGVARVWWRLWRHVCQGSISALHRPIPRQFHGRAVLQFTEFRNHKLVVSRKATDGREQFLVKVGHSFWRSSSGAANSCSSCFEHIHSTVESFIKYTNNPPFYNIWTVSTTK